MAIKKYQENGKIFWEVYVSLRSRIDPTIRIQKRKFGLESEKAALSEEKRLLRSATEEIANTEAKGITWESLLEQFELITRKDPFYRDRYQETTIPDYLSVLYKWTGAWLKHHVSEITVADVKEVVRNMHAAGMTRTYQLKLKNILNHVFRWGIEERIIKNLRQSPAYGLMIHNSKEEKVPEILTLEEIKKLLFHSQRVNHEWYPIWAMALLTGMRNGELHALLWSDIDFEKNMLTVSKSYNTRLRKVKCTKAGYWRNVPINPELKELLLALKAVAGEREQVLPRSYLWDKGEQADVLRTFCMSIGITSVKFHTLRACFATQLLGNRIDPARVMKICGWKDLKVMQRYIRLAGIDEKGATDGLKFLPTDADLMGEVVSLFKFKSKSE